MNVNMNVNVNVKMDVNGKAVAFADFMDKKAAVSVVNSTNLFSKQIKLSLSSATLRSASLTVDDTTRVCSHIRTSYHIHTYHITSHHIHIPHHIISTYHITSHHIHTYHITSYPHILHHINTSTLAYADLMHTHRKRMRNRMFTHSFPSLFHGMNM